MLEWPKREKIKPKNKFMLIRKQQEEEEEE
jgi:hypothetical protein